MVLDRLEERLLLASTNLVVSDASGTYGGTTNLSASLYSGGYPLRGEIIDFHLGANDLGTAITGQGGVAFLNNVSLAGINAGTYSQDITADFTGDVDLGYTASSDVSDLTVTMAPLTITANDQTKVYGAALPAFTASYTGFVNGDTSASLTSLPTLGSGADAASHVAGSPYRIGFTNNAVDSNYTISYVNGSLAVTTAPLTITANNQTKVYGAALPTLTAAYSGFVNGDTSASLATLPTLTTTATAASHVSGNIYPITASGAVDTDYSISYTPGGLGVLAAPLTITADNQTKAYGAALPALTASYAGLVNGDTSASLTTQPTLATTATAASHVSNNPYAVTVSGAVDSDYTISYVAGSLTITTAPLTITADDQTKTYGAALPTLTASYTGFVNGDTSASLTTAPTLATTATAASRVSGNPYPITASAAADTDYAISYVAGSLTITTAPLTITATDQTKVYGAALPTLTASYTGLVNGDTSASLTTLPTITTTATAASHVSGSPYAITALGAVDADYSFIYVPGSLAVTAAPLTITADNQTKVYGSATPLTATYAGLVNGDTPASLDIAPMLTAAGSHVAGSPYAITAGGAVDSDYTITYAPGSLTVTAAPLTITAADQTKVYGAAVPALTASYSGLVNGDTAASLTTAPTLATMATAASHVSGNPYDIAISGAADSDYTITYALGSLTVTAAPLSITADNQTKVYGQANPAFTASYSGFVLGEDPSVLSGTLGFGNATTAASHVGSYAITPNGLMSLDYTATFIDGSLAVTPAPLQITANDVVKTYGQAVPTLTAAYSGFVNGDTSSSLTTPVNLTTTAGSSSHVGVYPVVAGGAISGDYSISYTNGTASVTPAVLTVTPDDIVKPFGAAVPSLTVTYGGFVNGDTAASLTTPVSVSTTATAASDVGTYPITASGGSSTDYTIVDGQGTLTVAAASAETAFVTSIYQAILGRAPEAQGLDDFLTKLRNGATQSDVIDQIYYSPEAGADRARLGISANPNAPGQIGLVTSLYQTILGRLPEGAGLDGWLARLDSGVSVTSVASQIYNSPEGVAYRATTPPPVAPTSSERVALVTALYETILGRTPEPSGLNGWLADLNAGMSPESVAAQIEDSPEASNDRAAAGPVAFVNSLYRSFVGRNAEAYGLNIWLMDLNDGVSRSKVAEMIYSSDEAVAFRADHTSSISEAEGFAMALEAERNA